MLLIRKILFYLFLFIYFLLCPLLILYSLGYIFNPVNQEISQTGLIHLSTIPPDAQVFLGKSRYKYKTPASITGLLPGTYPVHLKLKGYRPWQHQVAVRAGESAAFPDILFIPERLRPYRLSPEANYSHLIPLPANDAFLVQKGSGLKDFYFFSLKREGLLPLVLEDSPYFDFPVVSIFNPVETIFIVFGGSLWERKYLLVDLGRKGAAIKDITKLFSERPLSIVASQESKNIIFVLYKNHMDQVDIESMSLYPGYIEDVKGFGLSGQWLYVLGENNIVSRRTAGQEVPTALFDEGVLPADLFSKSSFYKIEVLENEIYLFWGDRGDWILVTPPYSMAKEGVAGFEFLSRKQQLMYWTKEGVGIIEFDGEDRGGLLSQGPIRSQPVYEKGKSIRQCFWAYQGTHLLFRDKDDVFLLELAPDGKHHVEYLASVRHDSDIFYSEGDGSFYYLDPQGSLMKIRIVPEEGMR